MGSANNLHNRQIVLNTHKPYLVIDVKHDDRQRHEGSDHTHDDAEAPP